MIDPGHQRPLGTKILHQPQRLFCYEALKPRHNFYVGTAESVDGLLGIPNYEQLPRGQRDVGPLVRAGLRIRVRRHLFCQESGNLGLDGVGVLGLVH